jgi:hypothetical protein
MTYDNESYDYYDKWDSYGDAYEDKYYGYRDYDDYDEYDYDDYDYDDLDDVDIYASEFSAERYEEQRDMAYERERCERMFTIYLLLNNRSLPQDLDTLINP